MLAAGPALAGSADGGQAVLTFPAGAVRIRCPLAGPRPCWRGLPCWMQLAGISDALLAGHDGSGRPGGNIRPSLEDGLLSAWSGPFAWLMLAEPFTVAQLGELADEVALAQLGAQRSDSPRSQLAAQRLSARHAELRQAAATGLWRVRFMAGGPSPLAAAQVAGLLCASTDLDGLPYALALLADAPGWRRSSGIAPLQPGPASHGRRSRSPFAGRSDPAGVAAPGSLARSRDPGRSDDRDTRLRPWPFYASSRLVAALARPPAREVPGIRLVLRPDFDVTPETGGLPPGGRAAGRRCGWGRCWTGTGCRPGSWRCRGRR